MNIAQMPAPNGVGHISAGAAVGDSGFECLSALAAHFRRPLDVEHLRHELALFDRRATGSDLVRAAQKTGLRARLFQKRTFKKLQTAPRPLIVRLNDDSFKILVAIEGEEVRLFDPGNPVQLRLPVSSFLESWSGDFILVTRRYSSASERFGLGWFVTSLKKFKRELALVLVVSVFVQVLALASALLFQIVIDKVLVHNSASTLVAVVVGMVAVNSFQAVIEFLRTYLLSHTASRIDVELGAGVFNRPPHEGGGGEIHWRKLHIVTPGETGVRLHHGRVRLYTGIRGCGHW